MWARSRLSARLSLPAADVLCSDGDAVCVFLLKQRRGLVVSRTFYWQPLKYQRALSGWSEDYSPFKASSCSCLTCMAIWKQSYSIGRL